MTEISPYTNLSALQFAGELERTLQPILDEIPRLKETPLRNRRLIDLLQNQTCFHFYIGKGESKTLFGTIKVQEISGKKTALTLKLQFYFPLVKFRKDYLSFMYTRDQMKARVDEAIAFLKGPLEESVQALPDSQEAQDAAGQGDSSDT